MADRYWVGGTANWDATAGTKWATTSGGAGGAAVPTSADNVFFDAASGAVTVTVSATANCLDLNFTGFTGTFAGSSSISIYGSLFYSTTMTRTHSGTKTFRATTTGKTITLNGKALGGSAIFNGAGGEWILQDSWSSSNITLTAGTLNTNDKSISALVIGGSGSSTRVLSMGSSVVTLTSNGGWDFSGTNMTFNCGTSTIKLGNAPLTNPQTFAGNGFTYYNVEIPGTGNNIVTVSGNNTFNTFTVSRTSAFTLKLTDGSTQIITNWVGGGTAGNIMTLTNTASTTQATLTKAGGGSATVDYANISWIAATPSFTWSATNSTDSGNNTGWNFGGGFGGNGLFFGSNF